MSFPWLTVLGAVPLAGSGLLAVLPGGRDLLAKRFALVVSLVVLALTVVIAAQFDPSGATFQFTATYPWIPAFGVHYAVGVDGVALVLISLAALLVPLVVLASWNDAEHAGRSVKAYFALLLLLEAMMIGVFAATDVFLFYVLFEAMLVPMYFIIGSYGGARRHYAAVKFLLYSLVGGLLMLVAVLALYAVSASGAAQGTFLFQDLVELAIDPATQKWLFLGFFVAFAIKAPMWPFHTWLPDSASQAPTGSAVLLVGVLDKVGTFGMLRYCLHLFPDASRFFSPLVIVLSVVGILYGALLAIGQADLKRLLGYVSISHFGLITLGIFAMTLYGQSGATLYMFNHGLSTGALFLAVGFMISRRGSPLIADYGGMQKVAPVLAGTFLVAGLSGLALPGLSTFVSEFLVLVGTFARYQVAAVLGALGMILAAMYVLWMYQRTMTGPARAEMDGTRDLSAREIWAIGPLIALLIVFGFYPKPVLDVINPAIENTVSRVQVEEPKPAVPAEPAQPAAQEQKGTHE